VSVAGRGRSWGNSEQSLAAAAAGGGDSRRTTPWLSSHRAGGARTASEATAERGRWLKPPSAGYGAS